MPDIDPLELQSIKNLEAELRAQQAISVGLLEDDAMLVRRLDIMFAGTSIYSDPKKMQRVLTETQKIYKEISSDSRAKGRVMGRKELDKWLDQSERMDRSQKQIRIINQATQRQADRRLAVIAKKIDREFRALKGDVAVQVQQLRNAGFSSKQILTELSRIGAQKVGFQQAFTNKARKLSAVVARAEIANGKLEAYMPYVEDDALFQWITISTNVCPDCQARAGKVLRMSEWKKIGVPRAGFTVCDINCYCQLIPHAMSEKMLPNTKEFKWNRESQVLTPASTARTLKSKKAQPDNQPKN